MYEDLKLFSISEYSESYTQQNIGIECGWTPFLGSRTADEGTSVTFRHIPL